MDTSQLVGKIRTSGTQVVYQSCPICGNTSWKLYVDPSNGKWFCFGGRHGAGGILSGFQPDYDDTLLRATRKPEKPEPVEVELPPNVPLCRTARKYLHDRGFGEGVWKHWGVVEWRAQGRIIIPFFSSAGVLTSWTSRLYMPDDKRPKYKHAPGPVPVYVPVAFPDTEPSNHMVVVEGPLDAWRVQCAGHLAGNEVMPLAINGKNISQNRMKQLLTLANRCGIITVLLDSDAVGEAVKLQAELAARTCASVRLVQLPRGMDPADMGLRELARMLGL